MIERVKKMGKLVLIAVGMLQGNLLAQTKPHILWITIEDSSPQFFGCYGNPMAKTPAIDKLAAEGIRFVNAFSPGTVCSPSRAAIITGIKTQESGMGHHRSSIPLPSNIQGFPYYLKQAGYYTSNNSKEDYNVAEGKKFSANAWHESSGKAGWAARAPGQPFFSVINIPESHQAYTMVEPYDKYAATILAHLDESEQVKEGDIVMPPFYRNTPAMRKEHARVYNAISLTDKRVGEILSRLEADGLRDSTIIFFFADHGEGIPRGKTNGVNLGHRVPMVLWFPPMYQHLSPWGKPGAVATDLVDFEDLAPTVLKLAGGEVPVHLNGRDFIGRSPSDKRTDLLFLSNDRADSGPDLVRSATDGRYFYSRNFHPYLPQQRFIRYFSISPIFKLMWQDLADKQLDSLQRSLFEARPAEYLFDIENDSWETKNLINDASLQSLLEKMRTGVLEQMINGRDVHLLPEYELKLLAEKRTPYEFRQDVSVFPAERVAAAAALSGRRDGTALKAQQKLLTDSEKLVRYWAVTGLLSHGPGQLKTIKKSLRLAMSDSYPPVQLLAALLCFEQFGDKKARDLLEAFIQHENADLALLAVSNLLYSKNAKMYLPTVEVVLKKNQLANKQSKLPFFLTEAMNDFIEWRKVENIQAD